VAAAEVSSNMFLGRGVSRDPQAVESRALESNTKQSDFGGSRSQMYEPSETLAAFETVSEAMSTNIQCSEVGCKVVGRVAANSDLSFGDKVDYENKFTSESSV